MGSNITSIDSPGGIIDVLKSMDRGNTIFDLEDALTEVVNGVTTHKTSGEVTLTLSIKIDPQTDAIKVIPDVKMKKPKRPKRGSLFFPTPEGRLSRANPNQSDMFPDN